MENYQRNIDAIKDIEKKEGEKKQNQYEKLFDEFMDTIEFTLVKHKSTDEECDPNIWSLKDKQESNLGYIEEDRFAYADEIFDRLDRYIEDYFVRNIEECLETLGYNIPNWSYYEDLAEYARPLLPDNDWDLDVLEMIGNHAKEIRLDHCTYEEE